MPLKQGQIEKKTGYDRQGVWEDSEAAVRRLLKSRTMTRLKVFAPDSRRVSESVMVYEKTVKSCSLVDPAYGKKNTTVHQHLQVGFGRQFTLCGRLNERRRNEGHFVRRVT
jgi:hypothetical protein